MTSHQGQSVKSGRVYCQAGWWGHLHTEIPELFRWYIDQSDVSMQCWCLLLSTWISWSTWSLSLGKQGFWCGNLPFFFFFLPFWGTHFFHLTQPMAMHYQIFLVFLGGGGGGALLSWESGGWGCWYRPIPCPKFPGNTIPRLLLSKLSSVREEPQVQTFGILV